MMRTVLTTVVMLAALATYGEAGVRNYFAPLLDGARLDACLTAGTDCGKPVADAFCKAQGFETAILFQREHATNQSTRRLGSGDMCDNGACTSFRQIKCFSPGEIVAAAT